MYPLRTLSVFAAITVAFTLTACQDSRIGDPTSPTSPTVPRPDTDKPSPR